MPYSLEAERAVLGSILLDDKAIFPVAEMLLVSDFYWEAHRLIFDCCLWLIERETSVDSIILRQALLAKEWLEKCGGSPYLASLTEGLPRALNIRHYARIIKDKSLLRQIIGICNESMTDCFEPSATAAFSLEKINAALLKVSSSSVHSGFRPIRDIASEGYKELEQRNQKKLALNGIDSGFWDLNRFLGGMKPGNMIVVAARPSMGKTSLVLNISCHAALRCGKSVGIFSLEMSCGEVYDRIVSAEAGVDLYRLALGEITRENWKPITDKTGRLADCRIWIDDSSSLNISQTRARALALSLSHGLDLLVVDYLQLIKGQRKGASRYEDVTEISRELKLMAKELQCPVIAVSQLSRSAEGEKPQLSHLRESGAIEQDADVVLLIAQKKEADNSPEIHVAKNRNGPTGTFKLAWDKHITKFTDYSPAGFTEI